MGHRDAAGHFPFPNGGKTVIGDLLHRVFIGLFVEHGLHLVQMFGTGHHINHPSARAQHPQEFLLCKGRKAVQQQVGPALAAACIQQMQRRLRAGRLAVLCAQLTHRFAKDAVVSGIQERAAGGHHLLAVAGGFRPGILDGQ